MKPIHLGQSFTERTQPVPQWYTCFVSLLVCSCFYIWQIYRVPAGLELRSWFCVNFGCSLIVLWQIAIVIGTIVLGKKFVSKQSAGIFSIFYYFILFLFCSSIVLYLAWNFVKISIVNDKDFVNETGTLTVYHSRDILKSDDYEYFLYDKVGVLYRRYLRDMKDETDYWEKKIKWLIWKWDGVMDGKQEMFFRFMKKQWSFLPLVFFPFFTTDNLGNRRINPINQTNYPYIYSNIKYRRAVSST